MAQPGGCLGHQERENTQHKILKMAERQKETPDENIRVSIRGRSGQRSWSLKELEDDYKSKPEWKVMEDGGILDLIARVKCLFKRWPGAEESRLRTILSVKQLRI